MLSYAYIYFVESLLCKRRTTMQTLFFTYSSVDNFFLRHQSMTILNFCTYAFPLTMNRLPRLSVIFEFAQAFTLMTCTRIREMFIFHRTFDFINFSSPFNLYRCDVRVRKYRTVYLRTEKMS